MTEYFNAGEHVKIVISDDGYDYTLGDQKGMVGTVVTAGSNVYVTFPHTGEQRFYYVASEIERAGNKPTPAPKPEPKPKYAKGDWVKVTGYAASSTWEGAKGKVTLVGGYDARDGYSYVIECADGKPYNSGGFDEKYLKPTTAPRVNKFKVGDWVEIHGCCGMDTCNGTTWQVESAPDENTSYYNLKSDNGASRYLESTLKATTAPAPKPKFKVGDWVEITGWGAGINGDKVQVKALPASGDGFYAFEDKPTSYGFRERYLKVTEAPHWSESKPVGAVAQATYSGGGVNRVLIKTAEDNWLHVYQNYDGKANVTANRSNARTKNLFGSDRNITWVSSE